MEVASYFAVAALAYLLGSVPTGFLMGKARGIDIRKSGSGNIGATNAIRILGKPAGVTVLVIDGLKGYAACGWLVDLFINQGWASSEHEMILRIVAGLAAVLGHNYTCWLWFRGGKGIATSAGVLAALVPAALVVIFVVWVIVFALTRYVSLASIAASFTLPFAAWATRRPLSLVLVTAAMAVLAIYKHKSNIQRLMNGTEHRFGGSPDGGPR